MKLTQKVKPIFAARSTLFFLILVKSKIIPHTKLYIEGGEYTMMDYGNYSLMMGGGSIIAGLIWLVVLIDLVLLGFWLLKQIQK